MVKSNRERFAWTFIFVGLLCLVMTGCATNKKTENYQHAWRKKDAAPKKAPVNLDKVPNAVPKAEPLSRYGNRFKNNRNSYVTKNKRYTVMPTSKGYRAKGLASWYGTKFHGRKTSSGERYNMYAMTAAHRTLPLPTYAKVSNLENGKSVIVKVNDRGPFHRNRIIDLSYVAAHKLGMLGKGTSPVLIESIDPRDHKGFVRHEKRAPMMITPPRINRKVTPPPVHETPKGMKQRFYVQLGSFTQKQSALELASKVGRLSKMTTRIAEYRKKNQPIFRVRVGPYQDEDEAVRMSERLAAAGKMTPMIIAE